MTEQSIGGLNDEGMTDGTSRKVAALENTEEATSECILTRVCGVQAQRAKRIALNSIKEATIFDVFQQNIQNMSVRPQTVTNANIARQDIQTSSALHVGKKRMLQSKPFQCALQILMETAGELVGQEAVDGLHQEGETRLTK